jgi:hypothetical protein
MHCPEKLTALQRGGGCGDCSVGVLHRMVGAPPEHDTITSSVNGDRNEAANLRNVPMTVPI